MREGAIVERVVLFVYKFKNLALCQITKLGSSLRCKIFNYFHIKVYVWCEK